MHTKRRRKLGQVYSLAFSLLLLYIAGMAKTNINAANTKDSKEYEKHVCGECGLCTPVTASHTLTVKDRRPTLGRCPEHTRCVLLSERAGKCFSARKPPGSA